MTPVPARSWSAATTTHRPGSASASPSTSPGTVCPPPTGRPPSSNLGERFNVTHVEDVLARLPAHGAQLVGELEQYEDSYRLW